MSIVTHTIPPTMGLEQPDPSLPPLDFVTAPREWNPGNVLSCNVGLGGQNAAVIFSAFDETESLQG